MQLLVAAVFAFSAFHGRSAYENGPLLRVGLTRAFGHPSALTLKLADGARLSVGEQDVDLASGDLKVLWAAGGLTAKLSDGSTAASGSALRITPADVDDCTSVGLKKSMHRYRGTIELRAGADGMLVVDELPTETYLRGVIAAEMPPSAGAEALNAQTIAARSYALKNRGRYRARGYDVSDNTDCQVYGGADAEKPPTNAAVRDTAGMVLLKDGVLLLADFYDDCGGVTSPGDRPGDYPPSVRDAEEPEGPDYCARGLYHTWTVSLTSDAVRSLLSENERAKVGAVNEIRVAEADSSGRAKTVEVVGENGSVKMSGSAFRGRVGYSKLKSTLFTVSKDESGVFTIRGKGYGHGQGLCQMGAMGMAAAPYNHTCREILDHYFPGSEIVQFTGQTASPQADPEARGSLASRSGRSKRRK